MLGFLKASGTTAVLSIKQWAWVHGMGIHISSASGISWYYVHSTGRLDHKSAALSDDDVSVSFIRQRISKLKILLLMTADLERQCCARQASQ